MQATGIYQLMTPLSEEEYAALKEDIAKRGVMVPIEFDESGNVLDGHNRLSICQELGITDYPRVVRSGLSEEEKREHVLKLNLARRHLDAIRWGSAFAELLSVRGVRLAQGSRNDKTSATVAEVAGELGVPDRTARRRVQLWRTYEGLPKPLRSAVDSGEMPLVRAAKLAESEKQLKAREEQLEQKTAALATLGVDGKGPAGIFVEECATGDECAPLCADDLTNYVAPILNAVGWHRIGYEAGREYGAANFRADVNDSKIVSITNWQLGSTAPEIGLQCWAVEFPKDGRYWRRYFWCNTSHHVPRLDVDGRAINS